jgi:DNA-directed RNA polymerase subunit M/transcription elongation factor TFIIS
VCGDEFAERRSFCPKDGAALVQADARGERPATGQPMICPTCRRGYEPGARTCPKDADDLVPYSAFMDRSRRATGGGPAAQGRICPKCGAKYPPNVVFCGKDGAELVLVN